MPAARPYCRIMFAAILLIVGFALLIMGGDLLVRGAVKLAERARVSPLIVGLVIVGFGTSMPELVASVQAAFAGSPGIAWGNIAGSNLANTLLILGTAALIAPFAIRGRGLWRDSTAALVATLVLYGAGLGDFDGVAAGTILLALLTGYLGYAYFEERTYPEEHGAAFERGEAEEGLHHFRDRAAKGWIAPIGLTLLGLVLLVAGGRWLVMGAIDLATLIGLSETVIGLTIVALGTSAPELVTSALAALRGQGSLAFGNVVGSNIYNLLGIGGVTAIVAPGSLPPELVRTEFPLLLASAVLLLLLAAFGGKFGRLTGGLLLGSYIVYLAALIAAA